VTSTESVATAFFIDIPSCFWINWYKAIVRGRELVINYRQEINFLFWEFITKFNWILLSDGLNSATARWEAGNAAWGTGTKCRDKRRCL
jgi:hypothetical protein